MAKRVKVSIGVFAHNEEANIEKALDSVLKQSQEKVEIQKIIVVSSGSYDTTNDIVQAYTKKDVRIQLVEEFERKGKSAAINLFMKKTRSPVLITMSADLRLSKHAIDYIAAPFTDESIGMVGGHPIPKNTKSSAVGKEIEILWELHHRVSLVSPKCGELVAFRNIIRELPVDSAVDEATIEVLLRILGYGVIYAPRAVVYNKGPVDLADYLKQRRRVTAGHHWVLNKYNYKVSTMDTETLFRVVLGYVYDHPEDTLAVIKLLTYELMAKLTGWLDYYLLGRNPYIWSMVKRG